jgi:hypothetical protein
MCRQASRKIFRDRQFGRVPLSGQTNRGGPFGEAVRVREWKSTRGEAERDSARATLRVAASAREKEGSLHGHRIKAELVRFRPEQMAVAGKAEAQSRDWVWMLTYLPPGPLLHLSASHSVLVLQRPVSWLSYSSRLNVPVLRFTLDIFAVDCFV